MEKAESLQIQNSAEGLVLSRENPASHQTEKEMSWVRHNDQSKHGQEV